MKPVPIKLFRFAPVAKPIKRAIFSGEIYDDKRVKEVLPKTHLWIITYKADGIRCQLHKKGKTIRLFSDEAKRIRKVEPIIEAARKLKADEVILDGELMLFKNGKNTHHQGVAGYVHSLKPATREELQGLRYAFWDKLWFSGRACTHEPYLQRWNALPRIGAKFPMFIVRGKLVKVGEIEKASKAIKSPEGFMIRSANSTYWQNNLLFKVKHTFDVDVVIGKIERTKGDAYVYHCFDRHGNYVGQTYAQTHTVAKVGDVIRVMVSKMYKHKDPKTGKEYFHWWSPIVKAKQPALAKGLRGKRYADPQITFQKIHEATI